MFTGVRIYTTTSHPQAEDETGPSRAVTRLETVLSTVGVRLGTKAAARLSRAKAELLKRVRYEWK